MVFLLVNTTSPNAQYFIPGGDPPGNSCLIFLFLFTIFSVYFDFVTKIEDCARNENELLALLAFNILLSLANLIVNCTVACRGKRPQKRSAQYDVHMEPQGTVPQDIEPQETVPQDIDSQETVPEVYFYFSL